MLSKFSSKLNVASCSIQASHNFRYATNNAQYTAPSIASIDVHTHMYFPRYMELLQKRNEIPKIIINKDKGEQRLVILPSEESNISTSFGRPIGSQYFDIKRKLEFMDMHNIETSIISLANPWLDFLDAEDSILYSRLLNEDLQEMSVNSNERIFGFGVLPNTAGMNACMEEVEYCSDNHPNIRGFIMGTHGIFGTGMDDQKCIDLYQTIAQQNMIIFVHPHFGVGNEYYSEFGHALHLALGFTFETTVAISRLILNGILDECPDLCLLLAHSGGTLPFLSGRLNSCYQHEISEQLVLKKQPLDYIRDNFVYDSVIYNEHCLQLMIDLVGEDKLMFGTDHPFFPPVCDGNIDGIPWLSTTKNQSIVCDFQSESIQRKIFRENAIRILNLKGKAPKITK